MPREFVYRSAELELDRLGVLHGWMPSAKREAIDHFSKFFKRVDNDLIHMETADTIEEWAARQKTERPHWFLSEEVVDLVDAALGGGPKSRVNIDARGRLFREVGEARYNDLLRQWGATVSKNGTRPETETAESVEKAKTAKNEASNPWSAAGWNITRQGEVVKAMGMEKAAQIAKAAGSRIGATRPAA